MLALMFVVLLRCVQVPDRKGISGLSGTYHRHPGSSPSMHGRGHQCAERGTGHCASAVIAQMTLIHGCGSVVMVSLIQLQYSS